MLGRMTSTEPRLQSLEVALLPAEAAHIDADLYVVVDQLRATTTIATLFAAGLARLTAVADEQRARDLAKERGALLFGEVGGLPPQGFDYGNSPLEAKEAPVVGREAVLFTTNGTRALCGVAGRAQVVTGAVANIAAVVAEALRHQSVCIVAAGNARGERFGLEDFGAAGLIAREVQRLAPETGLGDAAKLAILAANQRLWPIEKMLRESQHALRTAELGFVSDIEFSLEPDTSRALPSVVACGPGWAELVDANAEQQI